MYNFKWEVLQKLGGEISTNRQGLLSKGQESGKGRGEVGTCCEDHISSSINTFLKKGLQTNGLRSNFQKCKYIYLIFSHLKLILDVCSDPLYS